ncbi:cupin [Sphingobium sp. 22B]|uniref:cupin domain-containing protein n=1 Tax=unclassified Sphingobium TaxID=2611147 RepID=UPI000785C424|nr:MULTISPECIES: cupin domain-containing protein [unclassified Sphingobium]KXU32878.1 cupin [Sphingobium sp. AM]KYC33059.1 cupin [Sphingobium sp. 22B]OAP33285.1 cupin [Sphingobium sp. 20006FA]
MDGCDEAAAGALIRLLDLAPHPEGGWFRESWRAPAGAGERAGGTAIYFLLEAHQASHWHRVDAVEHWFWHAGAPLTLSIADEGGAARDMLLGGDVLAGQQPQGLVPAHHWQAARPMGGWTLVSCVVVPGFEFSGFTLAPPGWSPGG